MTRVSLFMKFPLFKFRSWQLKPCCISPLEVTAELFLASRSEDEADCRSEQEWRMKFLFVSLWAKN
jgi:hypothetical protein